MSLQSNPDPGRTLGQFGLAVLGLVIAAAALFWAIDLVTDDAEPVAAPTVAEPSASPSPTMAVTPSPTPAPSPSPTPEPTPSPSATPTETSTPDESPSPSPTPEVSETPSEESEDTSDDVDLSETSVQVLDGILDGSDRAEEIADDLEDDGYRVVAFGPSSVQYENTTVVWTDGHEDEAERLADDNGWDEIVFNEILSETVDVHVVVGLDEQE
jgi:hypothetical protein